MLKWKALVGVSHILDRPLIDGDFMVSLPCKQLLVTLMTRAELTLPVGPRDLARVGTILLMPSLANNSERV